MRIAAITASFLPQVGGAEFAVHHLARQWSAKGHEVTVFNQIADRPHHADADYAVQRYSTMRGMWRFARHRQPFSWYAARQLERVIRVYRPDFISAHFGYPVGVWLSRISPVPRFVITCHGPALDERPVGVRSRYGIDELLATSFNRSNGVVAISTHARKILQSIGVTPSKIHDIPNGVEVDRFQTPVTGFDLREHLELRRDAVVVLSVGRDTPEKDYGTGLRAFAAAAARDPALHYVMLGRLTQRWRPLVEELGIAERVRFSDGLYGDELIAAYQQADIFMLCSVKELCPLVVPEAMAAGLPEIVTNVSGAQDMVVDGENGLVVEPGDVDGLGAALSRLGADEPLRRRMGMAGRERSPRYDWGTLAESYLELAP